MQSVLKRHNFIKIYKYSTVPYCSKALGSGYKPRIVEKAQIVTEPICAQPDLPKFSFILPPPNVTGNLHLGHALMCTVQDVIARHRRSIGFDVCWVPGTDHAGIATQVVVEKHLRKQKGLGRHDLGKSRFIEEVWTWRKAKGHQIKDDLIRMGTIMNWDREFFTMDDRQSRAVRHAFIRLFDEGLIYRGDSLVNWSCSLESTISDIEVDNVDIAGPSFLSVPGYEKPIAFGHITDIAYRVCDRENEHIVVSTTRPETMLGDVAVAVHPNDIRYSHLRNFSTRLWHPFRHEEIPLVFDESVDPEFGTGAVKITPAHDRFDFDLAKRHALRSIAVINDKGFICEGFDGFSGAPRFEAREIIKHKLTELGQLKGTRPHSMQLPICSRSKDIIEHILKPQWFLRCDKMSEEAIAVVKSGEIVIQPESFQTEWNRWLSDSRDWCLSRQLWWGHAIPVYECSAGGKSVWVAAHNKDEARKKAAKNQFQTISNVDSINIRQDNDVLDTWFSSALLPFSAFGWPDTENCSDFKRFYPQDLLETGHDILFFWVARMVMLGKYLTGVVPFRTVLLHGIVCDAHGRKMSKSLGNVIAPEQVIAGATLKDLQAGTKNSFDAGVLSYAEYQQSIKDQAKLFPNGIPECGTDALRFTLLSYNIKSHFINFDVNDCHTNKLFFNKVWQATRFTVTAHQKWSFIDGQHWTKNKIGIMDRWILSRLARTVETVDRAMNAYQFHVAVSALKSFLYQNLCDVYLETTKNGLSSDDEMMALNHCAVLNACLRTCLKRMEPFTPFLSQELLAQTKSISKEFKLFEYLDASLEKDVQEMLDICGAVRHLKSQRNITKKHLPHVRLQINDPILLEKLRPLIHDIKTLTFSSQVHLCPGDINQFPNASTDRIVARSTAGSKCSIAIEVRDKNAINQITASDPSTANDKKFKKLETELERLQSIVSNEGFRRSASAKVQQQHLKKIESITLELQTIVRIRDTA